MGFIEGISPRNQWSYFTLFITGDFGAHRTHQFWGFQSSSCQSSRARVFLYRLWHAFSTKMYLRYVLLLVNLIFLGPWSTQILPLERARLGWDGGWVYPNRVGYVACFVEGVNQGIRIIQLNQHLYIEDEDEPMEKKLTTY